MFLVVTSAQTAATPDRLVGGCWDGHPDADADGLIEALPDRMTVDAGIEWGRARSDRVLVRNDDPTFDLPTGRYLWVGDA